MLKTLWESGIFLQKFAVFKYPRGFSKKRGGGELFSTLQTAFQIVATYVQIKGPWTCDDKWNVMK